MAARSRPQPGAAPAPWEDRVLGLLLGGAVGDAVGARFEGSARVPADELHRSLTSDGLLRWTDDTALQVTLADHLADLGPDDLDQDALALAFARTWDREPWRGYGGNPPRIFAAALAGRDWRPVARESFDGSGSLGNGGAMRAAPVGTLSGGPARVAEVARRSAEITHAHPVGRDGAVAIAVTVHHLLAAPRGAPPPVDEVLAACRRHLATAELEGAVAAAASAARATGPEQAAAMTGNGITAHEAVGAALCAALPRLEDPVAAVTFAVRMGGDTDTIAAMAGSIAGAFAGARAMPEHLLARLEGRERIESVAHRLATRTRGPVDPG
ncbi:ADP-ribosylglycohydrolase family protein [Blastococcus sp. SYSU DS1021]